MKLPLAIALGLAATPGSAFDRLAPAQQKAIEKKLGNIFLERQNNKSNNPTPQLPSGPFVALFENGIFPGKFLGLDPAKGIRWQHPAVVEPFHLKPGTVGFLQLQPTAKAGKVDCEVRLVSGDQFAGRLLSLDPSTLVLDTAHCGRLSIPRKTIKVVLPLAAEGALLIDGFGKPGDWKFTRAEAGEGLLERLVSQQGRWTIKNNGAHCPGGNGALLGRNLPGKPQALRVDFDLHQPKRDPQLSIQFFTDNLTDHRAGHCLDLTFRKGKASAKRLPANRDAGLNGRIGKAMPLPAMGNRAVRVTIHASLRVPKLHLAINGQHIGSWESEKPLKQSGAGLLLVQRGKQPVRIENLVIRQNNGTGPVGAQLPELPGNSKGDLIAFTNGDHIDGQLKEITNGIAMCRSSFGEIKVPLSRIRSVRLAAPAILKHKRPENAAHITLASQTRVTGQLKAAGAKTLSLNHASLGEIKISIDAIRTLDFQTPKKRIPGFPDPNAPLKPLKNGGKRGIPPDGFPDLHPPPDFNP